MRHLSHRAAFAVSALALSGVCSVAAEGSEASGGGSAPAADETPFLTKMSLKTLRCVPARAKAEEKRVIMARIMGIATGLKEKVDNETGQIHTAIVGNFEGINAETGQKALASVLYLPGGIQEVLESPLRGGETSIQFAVDVYAKPDSNKAGYAYDAEFLAKPSGADPLAALRESLSGAKALPAPTKK